MDAIGLLKAIRRRWLVVAATVGVALAVAGFTSTVVPPGPSVRSYQATTVLLNTNTSVTTIGVVGQGFSNLKTVAALATVGEVPRRAARDLGYQGNPLDLAKKVTAASNDRTGVLRITAISRTPDEARNLADTFAAELLDFVQERRAQTVRAQAQIRLKRLQELQRQIEDLDDRIPGARGSQAKILTAQRDAKVRQYGLAYELYQQVASAASDPATLQIIQDAVPLPVTDHSLIQVRSLPSRFLLALILGLLAGGGLVLLLERFDTRIRSKEAAERDFELPVLTEVPALPRKAREAGVITASRPRSAAADAFRFLATAIFRRPPRKPRIILVTSPGPGEGKTTVAANLAAALAEVGRRVLVISCDLHRPQMHRLMGVPNTKGLSDLLQQATPTLDGHVWKTSMENVRVIPSGPTPDSPAELLASPAMLKLLEQAVEVADVVILDTPPILAVSDTAALSQAAHAVVLVSQAGRTTAEAARRSTELLNRLGAPTVGVALNGVTEGGLPRGYYQYYGARDDLGDREDGRRRAEPAPPSEAPRPRVSRPGLKERASTHTQRRG